jgi:hypothetical protein
MAKKRQLAGKTTKLAKLPLTLALVEQSEALEASGGGAAAGAAAAAARETAEPLGAVYLHLIRELSFLLSQLQADPQTPPRALLPPHVPQPQQIRKSLRLAQQGLQDLQFLLSRP